MSRPSYEFFAFFARNGARCFIETGTYTGGGVSTGLRAGYEKVISIEAVSEFHLNCRKKFEKEIGDGRVELLLGDSGTVIGQLSPEGPAVYWLDAHFQGVEAEFDADNCPLDQELDAIIKRGNPDDVVLIDDLRLLINPKAWRGHNVEIERSLGRLMRAFPDHVAFFVDGHIPRDVFALMPARLARSFFLNFPLAHSAAGDVQSAPSIPSSRRLIVNANGNNDRIGNVLPLYGRLHLLAGQLGRSLSFPFAERSISKIFERTDGTPFSIDGSSMALNAALGRIIRTAEEVVEQSEKVAPYQYSEGVCHHIDLPDLGLRTIVFRGRTSITDPTSLALFDTDLDVVLKDPFPLTEIGGTGTAVFAHLSSFLRIRDDVKREAAARRLTQFGGAFAESKRPADVCLHIRQGDFRRWQDGKFFYDGRLVAKIVERIRERFADAGRQVRLTLISDEALPESLLHPDKVEWFAGDFAGAFVRIALSDMVLSNRSTFSASAASSGEAFLGSKCRYFSLGAADDALAALERIDFGPDQ